MELVLAGGWANGLSLIYQTGCSTLDLQWNKSSTITYMLFLTGCLLRKRGTMSMHHRTAQYHRKVFKWNEFTSKSIPGGLSLWCCFLEHTYLNSALDLNMFFTSGEGNNRCPALKWQFMSSWPEQSVSESLVAYSHWPQVMWPHTSWPLNAPGVMELPVFYWGFCFVLLQNTKAHLRKLFCEKLNPFFMWLYLSFPVLVFLN